MSSCLSHICFQSIAGALAAHHFFNTVEIKGLTLNLIFFFPFKSYANKIWTASWSLKHLSDSLWTLKDIKEKKEKKKCKQMKCKCSDSVSLDGNRNLISAPHTSSFFL